MPGGVAGAQSTRTAPYADHQILYRVIDCLLLAFGHHHETHQLLFFVPDQSDIAISASRRAISAEP